MKKARPPIEPDDPQTLTPPFRLAPMNLHVATLRVASSVVVVTSAAVLLPAFGGPIMPEGFTQDTGLFTSSLVQQ